MVALSHLGARSGQMSHAHEIMTTHYGIVIIHVALRILDMHGPEIS